jgi:hypothetical protein
MSTEATYKKLKNRLLTAFSAVLITAGFAGASEIHATEARQSTSQQHSQGGRDSLAPRTITDDRYAPLVTSGERSKPGQGADHGKLSGGSAVAQNIGNDFWFYYVDVQLFNDFDNDGYYHGIDVLFDVDTIYEVADVYAVLYLSYEGGPWNEYAVTDTFAIFGATSDDEYVVVTELKTGYPRGSYDLLIDLYDTYDGQLVASYGPADSSALANLPLEDYQRDDPRRGDTVVVVRDGGGALDAWTLIAGGLYVLAVHLVRRRQRMR